MPFILSSRRGEDGIGVIAAVDYDEGLFVRRRSGSMRRPSALTRRNRRRLRPRARRCGITWAAADGGAK